MNSGNEMFRCIATVLIALVLSACAAKHKSTPSFNSHAFQSKTPVQWAQEIERWEKLESISVYSRYLDIIRSFDEVEGKHVCQPKNVAKLHAALLLNPSSLIATTSLYKCAFAEKEVVHAEQLLENAKRISTQLIGSKNGQSQQQAIYIREIDEAYLILDLAAFSFLGSEIESPNGNFLYKIHTVDNITGEFRYQYFDNSTFMHSIHKSAIGSTLSKEESVKLTMETYRKNGYSPIQIFDIKTLLANNKQQDAMSALSKYNATSPILKVISANLALENSDFDQLTALVDPLADFADKGSIDAHLVLIDILLRHGQTKQEFQQVDETLNQIIKLSDRSTAFQLVLSQIAKHGAPYKSIENWWQATNNLDLVSEIGPYVEENLSVQTTPTSFEIQLLKLSVEYKDPNSMFILGKYYLSNATQSVEFESKGKILIQQSTDLGFYPAQQYQQEHLSL